MQVSSIRTLNNDGGERRFELSFSSEEPYDRLLYTEVLDHTEGAVDLTRLSEIGCVLYNHDRNAVVGKILRAWIEDGRGRAEIEFDDDENSEVIRQKVAGGTLKGVSVGYIVEEWEEVLQGKQSKDGRFSGPVDIAKKWTPFEISIVSVPADPTVGVGRELETAAATETKPCGRSNDWFAKQLQINKKCSKGGN